MVPAKTARDFMVTRMVTLHPDTHVLEAIRRLLKRRLTGAPVVDERGHYLGVFSEKCCLRVLTETTAAHAAGSKSPLPTAREFMVRRPLTLPADMDAFAAIDHLLRHRHCGALVVDENAEYVGVFSQRTSIRVLVHAAYDQLPSTEVRAWMKSDPGRVTAPDTDLLTVAGKFLDNSWRLLPVIEDGKLLGQVSRCDVLRAEHPLATHFRSHAGESADEASTRLTEANGDFELKAPSTVRSWMDRAARTISEDDDLFTVAHVFRDTPYRRLPVVSNGRLAGLVTRRHVLQAASQLIVPKTKAPHFSSQVFLSATGVAEDSSIM